MPCRRWSSHGWESCTRDSSFGSWYTWHRRQCVNRAGSTRLCRHSSRCNKDCYLGCFSVKMSCYPVGPGCSLHGPFGLHTWPSFRSWKSVALLRGKIRFLCFRPKVSARIHWSKLCPRIGRCLGFGWFCSEGCSCGDRLGSKRCWFAFFRLSLRFWVWIFCCWLRLVRLWFRTLRKSWSESALGFLPNQQKSLQPKFGNFQPRKCDPFGSVWVKWS